MMSATPTWVAVLPDRPGYRRERGRTHHSTWSYRPAATLAMRRVSAAPCQAGLRSHRGFHPGREQRPSWRHSPLGMRPMIRGSMIEARCRRVALPCHRVWHRGSGPPTSLIRASRRTRSERHSPRTTTTNPAASRGRRGWHLGSVPIGLALSRRPLPMRTQALLPRRRGIPAPAQLRCLPGCRPACEASSPQPRSAVPSNQSSTTWTTTIPAERLRDRGQQGCTPGGLSRPTAYQLAPSRTFPPSSSTRWAMRSHACPSRTTTSMLLLRSAQAQAQALGQVALPVALPVSH